MEGDRKIVEFDIWCEQCKHENLTESEDPCNACLYEPVNQDSHRPVNFEYKK